MKKKVIEGTQAKVDYAILNDSNLSKEQVKDGLQKDIESVAVFVSNLLRSKECMDALTEVMWQRYQKYHEQRKKREHDEPGLFDGGQAEFQADGKEVPNV